MEKSVHELFENFILELENSSFYTEYLKRKKIFLEDEDANMIIKKIKNLQKQRVNAKKMERVDITAHLTKEIDSLHEELEQLFTVSRYEELQQEVTTSLNFLNEQLEVILKK